MKKHILALCAAGCLLGGTSVSACDIYVDQWEVELIAQVTMAEAESETDIGRRLVIDTILNRVDSELFPDNIYDVIYQADQFSCMWDGRFYDVWPDEDVQELVREELGDRLNEDVLFYRTEYFGYGTPLFQEGNHFFSGI